ncbi:maleylacetoacetate isomerase [Sphingobium sp. LB126]|jgi:maleylacetoacetate isomerase/maleylpyruvate isomerase|uniref:maleylacetoacetate isomerase n=1 Tax=Sphingobium TaxID=165695 RepID=UPI000C200EC5|nr:maleylacetoacetate isomerase [Sphingobium sp. LB126]PJG45568.1 maleylacetoacetate isomerase [Sphingobium sp. LB126]
MILLHDFLLSSASYRVRIALNLKGLDYESRSYRLRGGEQRAPDYLGLNPAGLVPTLQIDGHILTQSLAIIDYLDARFPEPRLIPGDPAERARIMSLALTIACDIHPLNNLRVLGYLEGDLQQDEDAVQRWYRHWVALGFETIEAMLNARPDTLFAAGDTPGLVEICLVPQLYNARRYKVPLDPYPRLTALADRAAALPAFAQAAAGMPDV